MVYIDNLELTDKQYNTYILKKYLSKHYGEVNAINTIKNNSSKLGEIARALGEKDIAFFCLYYLQDIFIVKDSNEARELSPTHYEIWELLNTVYVKDELDKINAVLSRGMAKTTICDLALSVWLIVYKKSKFILLGAKKDDDASQFIDSIKKIFKENKNIIDEFGMLINGKKFKVNANEIEFCNGCYIRAVGSASSVRGSNFKGVRPETIIADDFQDEKNILTDEAREKTWNKWCKEIEKVGDTAVYRNGKKIKSATKIISIGTVLHNSCLISRLSRNKDYYTLLKRAIILKDNETVEDILESPLWLECKKLYFNDKDSYAKETAQQFYIDNKEQMKFPILWEEKWDCFQDIAVAYWENRMAFMSEMMNDATSIGEKWFKSNATQSMEDIESHTFTKTILSVDPAGVSTKKSGDYFAFVVESLANNSFKYVRKGEILRFTSTDEYINHVIDLLKEFKDITVLNVEKNAYLGMDIDKIRELIRNDPELRRRNIAIINDMQRSNKDEKISLIVDDVCNGRIIFCEDRVMKEAIEQMMEFQGQKYTLHDDFIDCIAEASLKLDTIKVIGKLQIFDIRNLGI
jgi:hypothetical protein